MSYYDGYKPEDNARRKANNVEQVPELGKNQSVKQYSTKPGQKSARQQAQDEARKYSALNRKQPVKKVQDPQVIAEIMARYNKKEAA